MPALFVDLLYKVLTKHAKKIVSKTKRKEKYFRIDTLKLINNEKLLIIF
jgi:hypothetical protein